MISKVKSKILFISIFFIIIISALSGCINKSDNTKNNDNGVEYANDFSFTLLDGTTKEMSDFKGKIVLLDFFGVRCPPCQSQMYELDKINKNYREDVDIISIDVWIIQGETINLVEQFIQAYEDLDEPVYLDWIFGIDDSKGTLLYDYASSGVPTLYILDKNGNIYYQNVGFSSYSNLAAKIDELLN